MTEWDGPSQSTGEHYRNLAFEGAFVNIIRGWLQSGMKETPEEMAVLRADVLSIRDRGISR
ncbi:MAG: TetR family transcriptional regulator C-terminal domain-containing protein [Oscillospiraceae bacterium]|nr:TetR family transcriptional regulator C-terminal domain-containing protein [Oscillospiraceae bacterium]